MVDEAIERELQRRLEVWQRLKDRGGPVEVGPNLVKELRIHRGQQGIFRDQRITGPLMPDGGGVAVGLLHTGSTYADDLFDDGVIYHYPVTSRGRRDKNEIAAMKACLELSLPLFLVVTPAPGAATRNVQLGWVSDFDDDAGELLISFSADTQRDRDDEDSPFFLIARRADGRTTARTRPSQAGFRFRVFKRYGSRCAFCGITEPKLLEAAHLCPVEENGSDDPRNGLVLCLTHHRAFDVGLVLVDPESLDLRAGGVGADFQAFGVAVDSIRHLPRIPHHDALTWVWAHKAPKTKKGPGDAPPRN